MRIKFLAIIASFLFVSIAISSCLDSDDNIIELSSDATVHAFGIDTIYGKHYKFTIDQLKKEIYNQDSLPVGADTIIDCILIDTFTVSGWITAGVNDTLFIQSDSVDLTGALTTEKETGNSRPDAGVKFKVWAPDGITAYTYTLKVNRHNLDPDSLVWKEMETFSSINLDASSTQKAVVLHDELWIYMTNSTNAYRTSTKAGEFGWTAVATNFPSNAKPETVVNVKTASIVQTTDNQDHLYVVASNEVYHSTDGKSWEKVTTLGNNIQSLIASFPGTLTGITTDGYLYTSKDGINWDADSKTPLPDNFPTEHIYSTNFTNTNNVSQVMAVGMPKTDEQTYPWFSQNGSEWVDLYTTSYDAFCPALNYPVCMYYGNTFYIFGGEKANKLDVIYSSITGIPWRKTEKKFLLPKEFNEITSPYSIAIDNHNYIWVIFGGNNTKNAVWRGRLNRLGFKMQ